MSSALCVFIHVSETGYAEGVPIVPSRGRSVSGYVCNLPKGTSTLRPLEGAMGTLCQRRHAEGKSVQKLDS